MNDAQLQHNPVCSSPARPEPFPARAGFTVMELLVVISIFVLVVAGTIPAFKSMIESSEKSLAENQLRVGLSAARDAAIQHPSADAAAAFFFQPGGKVSIVPCVSVGFLLDDEYNADRRTNRKVKREVFVPINTIGPIQMPRGFSVRGFTPPNTLSGTDTTALTRNNNGWYDSLTRGAAAADDPASMGLWVFPETNLTTLQSPILGWQRQSFIVRFKNGTGQLDSGNRSLALVIDPVAAEGFRTAPPYSASRLDKTSDLAASVRRLLARTALTPQQETDRIKLVGDVSIDSVLVRPVTELAVYSERSLGGALSSALGYQGVDRTTGTIYAAPNAIDGPWVDPGNFQTPGVNLMLVTTASSRWIEGRLQRGNAANGELIETDARIFTLQQYLGQLEELQ